MYQVNNFKDRAALDSTLATNVADLLAAAVEKKGKASIALSGGSTPKGFFAALSQKDLPWDKIQVTLADERWVDFESDASNTRLVHENLLQNKAKTATFFHLKQDGEMSADTLAALNADAKNSFLPIDVLILGMGEDGHTASLFPCSDEVTLALDINNTDALMKVVPKTAPNDRITFTYATLIKSQSIFLHVCGEGKKEVLTKALANQDIMEMPIRAFLQNDNVTTEVFWAE